MNTNALKNVGTAQLVRYVFSIISVIFSIVIAIKLYNFDFSNISISVSFSDTITVLISIFAIVMSILFYFKATETSNTFYNNTYKFTKDTAEVLGRIESGFDARLRHLDEGYTRLGEKFDRLPLNREKAERELKEEEEEVNKKELERQEMITHLVEKARLQEKEKEEFLSQLNEKENEIQKARREVDIFRNRLERAERQESIHRRRRSSVDHGDNADLPPRAREYLIDWFRHNKDDFKLSEISSVRLRRLFMRESGIFPQALLNDMVRRGMIDDDGDLTSSGARSLLDLLRDAKEE